MSLRLPIVVNASVRLQHFSFISLDHRLVLAHFLSLNSSLASQRQSKGYLSRNRDGRRQGVEAFGLLYALIE